MELHHQTARVVAVISRDILKHLQAYLDEYAFRFNRRGSKARGLLFYRLMQQAVATDPHPLTELIATS